MGLMAKSIHVLVCVLCAFFSSGVAHAQADKQGAIDLNNKVSKMIANLYQDGDYWGKEFSHIDSTTRKYSELAPIRIKMERLLVENLIALKTMHDVGGSYNFRMAAIQFMEVDKGVLNNAFKGIEQLKPNASPQEMQKAVSNLNKESKKEEAELKKIRKLQIEYGKQNGFKVTN